MNEQQRHADWAAVHRPETSTEELSRIARDHPEFMPAILGHENAPPATSHSASAETTTTPQAYAQAQQHPQSPAAQAQQHPQAYAPHASYTATGYASPPLNKLAYAALIVAAAEPITGLLYPLIYRRMISTDAFTAISFVTGAISWLLIIGAVILAVLALKKKDQPRGRWAAYAALGAAGSGALAYLSSIIGNFIVDFLPYW